MVARNTQQLEIVLIVVIFPVAGYMVNMTASINQNTATTAQPLEFPNDCITDLRGWGNELMHSLPGDTELLSDLCIT